jgi:AcrR family transcriptional regulator
MAARRTKTTDGRRQALLDAALECFDTLGRQKTTMADVRDRAGASTGSLYHHFPGKEELFAALYLDTIRQTQRHALEAIQREKSARDGVRALVASYLRWVSRNPRKARFLLTTRRAEFGGAIDVDLDRLNEAFHAEVGPWLARHAAAGILPRIGADVLAAILIGPSEDFARRWLRGKATTPLQKAATQLADAAWSSLQALRGSRR